MAKNLTRFKTNSSKLSWSVYNAGETNMFMCETSQKRRELRELLLLLKAFQSLLGRLAALRQGWVGSRGVSEVLKRAELRKKVTRAECFRARNEASLETTSVETLFSLSARFRARAETRTAT